MKIRPKNPLHIGIIPEFSTELTDAIEAFNLSIDELYTERDTAIEDFQAALKRASHGTSTDLEADLSALREHPFVMLEIATREIVLLTERREFADQVQAVDETAYNINFTRHTIRDIPVNARDLHPAEVRFEGLKSYVKGEVHRLGLGSRIWVQDVGADGYTGHGARH
ncbi:MAG: hypothetical protein JJU29_01145 [Verrucomicrobia bacterium]|nr:hypothetical protein [Verrucomicrobiota bacterium]MCH8510487.1 hypothetical protein [Kiritimatiellia bacterium]